MVVLATTIMVVIIWILLIKFMTLKARNVIIHFFFIRKSSNDVGSFLLMTFPQNLKKCWIIHWLGFKVAKNDPFSERQLLLLAKSKQDPTGTIILSRKGFKESGANKFSMDSIENILYNFADPGRRIGNLNFENSFCQMHQNFSFHQAKPAPTKAFNI